MAISAWELHSDRGVSISVDSALAMLSNESVRLWIDLQIDDISALSDHRAHFIGHPLAWEDAARVDQRPKIEDHGDHFFLIARSLDTSHDWLGMQLETIQMSCFLSERHLITIRAGAIHGVDQVIRRLEHGAIRPHSYPDGVLYALLDTVVGAYVPHVDRWEEEVERLDQQALSHPHTNVLARVLAIRKHVVKLRRLAATQAEILAELSRSRDDLVRSQTKPYFKDVHDHLVSVREATDALRDSVAIAVDIYLNSVNNRLNNIMRVFTMMSALMLPFTIITGIFGMNFSEMPGVQLHHGFWWTVIGMISAASGMFAVFYRLKMF